VTAREPELGAMLYRLSRAVVEAERSVLSDHGLEMWEYVVLNRLNEGTSPTQSHLAVAVGRDKTRLIPILDRLEAARLVERTPDPHDRRNRIVSLTQRGRALADDCHAAIRRLEDEELLVGLNPDQRRELRAHLGTLTEELEDARKGD
jgi:DNA-binding MarR family transcriptional regulator